ncbi:MAG: hypothetical protein Q8L46_01585 [candidate division WWE3 bacterium]|nr:hypothetical protein [candidate division WWE3 bacterium]
MKIPVNPLAFSLCQRRIVELLGQAGVNKEGVDCIITPGEDQEVRVEFHRRLGFKRTLKPKFCLRVILGTTFVVLPGSDWSRQFFDIFTADPDDQQLICLLNRALVAAKERLARRSVKIGVRLLRFNPPSGATGVGVFQGG